MDPTNMPFNLGSCWGLNRGGFLGLLAADPRVVDHAYNALLQAEGSLYDASQSLKEASSDAMIDSATHSSGTTAKQASPASLYTRWWLRLDPILFRNIPQNIEDVWACVIDKDRETRRSEYLRKKGVPEQTMPAFFVALPKQTATLAHPYGESRYGNVLKAWCRTLPTLFPEHELALVVTSPDEWELKRLEKELDQTARPSFGAIQFIAAPFEEPQEPEPPMALPVSEVGGALASWIRDALQNLQLEDAEVYPDLTAIYQSHAEALAHDSAVARARTAQVRDDLETLDVAPSFHEQFLALVKHHLPGRIQNLIYACAGSRDETLRHVSLQVAGTSDRLMRAWVHGSGIHKGAALPDIGRGPTAEALGLGLLWVYLHKHDLQTQHLREAIEAWLSRVRSEEVRWLCEYGLGLKGRSDRQSNAIIQDEDFFRYKSVNTFAPALRVQFNIQIPRDIFIHPPHVPDIWRLMLALQLTTEDILTLLDRPSGRSDAPLKNRIRLGLCTPQEFQNLASDSDWLTSLKMDRRGLPLFFRTSSY